MTRIALFLRSVGSLLDLTGTSARVDAIDPEAAMLKDWVKVGDDLRAAMAECKKTGKSKGKQLHH